MGTMIERRRFRRAELDVPVSIRSPDGEQAETTPVIGQIKNVSLAGVYCHLKAPCPFKPGDQLICSITIPPEQARLFPFTRLFGKGWVGRLEPIRMGRREGETPSGEELVGLAIVFSPDVTALGSVEF